jgi:hypothetical protein
MLGCFFKFFSFVVFFHQIFFVTMHCDYVKGYLVHSVGDWAQSRYQHFGWECAVGHVVVVAVEQLIVCALRHQ